MASFFVMGPSRLVTILGVWLHRRLTHASNLIHFLKPSKPSHVYSLRRASNLIRFQKFPRKSGGFTLIEALVVMGILSMLGGLGLFLNLDTYRSLMFRSERDTLISAILKARSQSMNNMCIGTGCTDGKAHGVYVTKGKYVIFQGQSYATRDTSVDEAIYAQNDTVGFSSPSYEVVFAQLSGSVTTPLDIGFNDGAVHYSTTSINTEGRVSWTN